MIVVAIIGVVAAIAVPQYNNYVARSQFAEALVLLDAAKVPSKKKSQTKIPSPMIQQLTHPQAMTLVAQRYSQ